MYTARIWYIRYHNSINRNTSQVVNQIKLLCSLAYINYFYFVLECHSVGKNSMSKEKSGKTVYIIEACDYYYDQFQPGKYLLVDVPIRI